MIARLNKNNFLPWVVMAVLVLSIAGVAVFMWVKSMDKQSINSFHDCQQAGGSIAESYPEQCFIDGKSFTNPDQIPNTSTDDYSGLGEKAAMSKAEQDNIPARVVERDGESLSVTMDYVPGRLNFYVRDGKVEKVEVESMQ
jgi:hypothetical protein